MNVIQSYCTNVHSLYIVLCCCQYLDYLLVYFGYEGPKMSDKGVSVVISPCGTRLSQFLLTKNTLGFQTQILADF